MTGDIVKRTTLFLICMGISLSSLAKNRVEPDPNKQSNCGEIVSVRVSQVNVQVVYHPKNAPLISAGGNNRVEIFRKTDFDPNLILNAAYEVMNNKKLQFCGGIESPDKLRMDPGFWITSKD